MYPFKDQLLREIEERKQRAEETKKRQKEDRRKEYMKNRKGLEGLQQDAEKRNKEFDKKLEMECGSVDTSEAATGRHIAYYKEFHKVVDASDVILEVLDARDPLGCRCLQVEEAVLMAGSNKKLILVLNKIDLVPKEVVERWMKYLRNELPTVAFKSSTQSQSQHLVGHMTLSVIVLLDIVESEEVYTVQWSCWFNEIISLFRS